MSVIQDVENTAIPPADLVKIIILQRRDYVIESMLLFDKVDGRDIATNTYIIRSSLMALFREIKSSMEADHSKKTETQTKIEVVKMFDELKEKVKSTDYKDLCEAFETIDAWLYKKGVTKFDVIRKLGGNIIERNLAKGWN